MSPANSPLKVARHRAGLSQNRLAALAGVDRGTVSRAEGGKYITPIKVSAIIEALNKITGGSITLHDVYPFPDLLENNQDNIIVTDVDIAEIEETPSAGLISVSRSIPKQNPEIRFGVSENGLLRLVPTLADENDYETIEALRAEMLAVDGPLDKLMNIYAKIPNTPQSSLFSPIVNRYTDELGKDSREINYAVLFARGTRLYAARATSDRQINTREWPSLDAAEEEAIDSICSLHGPLIMASAAGRRLVANAHEYETTPEVYRREATLIEELGQAIANEPGIAEPDTAQAIIDLTSNVEGDPQLARSRGLRLVFTGSALATIVGGVAWLSAGGTAAAVPALVITGVSMFLWEVVKKTGDFKGATDEIAATYDRSVRGAATRAETAEKALLERMAILVRKRSNLFTDLSRLRPEFGWVRKYIKADSPTPNAIPPIALSPKADLLLPDVEPAYRALAVIVDGFYLRDGARTTYTEIAHLAHHHINTVSSKLKGAVGQYEVVHNIFTAINILTENSFSRSKHVLYINSLGISQEDINLDSCLVFPELRSIMKNNRLKVKYIGDKVGIQTRYINDMIAGRPVSANLVRVIFDYIRTIVNLDYKMQLYR